MTLDHLAVLKAAEAANRDFGQWMPTEWLRLFEAHYNAAQVESSGRNGT